MTRRQLALLMSQAMVAAPALALGSRIGGIGDMVDSVEKAAHPQEQTGGPVYVVLWFDTEDYILPASDDAAKRIANFLSEQGVRATFKLVGEKARVLEARDRSDVIAALSRHEIGYHTNTHSQQPTIAEYESVLDWEQGAEEFDRHERSGFDDIGRIFGYAPTCFGQPGVSWAPQAFPALKKWGVHVYLDDGPQVQLDGKPFWYGGLLNIFGIKAGQQLEPNDDWSNLESAKQNFNDLHKQLSGQPAGGLVSFMFHPTPFVSQVFWDAVNFSNGANPPRSGWKPQPQKSPAQREQAFQYFEGLIRHIKSLPNVQFVTASQAYALYRDAARLHSFEPDDLAEIARQVSARISFQIHDKYALSSSEAFALLNAFVDKSVSNSINGPVVLHDTPYGPSSTAYGVGLNQTSEVSWSQFTRTSLDVSRFIEKNCAIPSVIWLGSSAVAPESYLLALSSVVQKLVNKEPLPETVKIVPAELTAEKWVAMDSVSIWNWPIFPAGFHSAHLMELARLQAWTLKPALLTPLQ
jgi:peptidoglycan/xylan/chitin deacetylase (PgdA/CDA1 family)